MAGYERKKAKDALKTPEELQGQKAHEKRLRDANKAAREGAEPLLFHVTPTQEKMIKEVIKIVLKSLVPKRNRK